MGELKLEAFARAADLANKRAACFQMLGPFAEDPSHDVEPVLSARVRYFRLGRVLGRKARDRPLVDIGRIRQDQVIAGVSDRSEQIALLQRDAVFKPMLFQVALRDFERGGRDVDGHDARIGKDARGENGERSAAGAQIEDGCDARWVAGPRAILGEGGCQQFADQAARDDDALVDIERHALDIGAVQEIGGGLARRHPRFDQVQEPRPLVAQEPGVEKRIERVDRQAEGSRG